MASKIMMFAVIFSFIISTSSRSRSASWSKSQDISSAWQRTKTEPETTSPTTNDCSDECTGVQMPNFCDYASHLWDKPSTPLEERNNIGMAKYLSSENTLKALSLGKLGKTYKLSYKYTNTMPAFGTRTWYTSLRHHGSGALGVVSDYYEYDTNNNTQCGVGWGWLDQRLMTSAIGNSGTQFDGMGHIFYINGEFGDERNYLFHNGFNASCVMEEAGVKYIGIEQLPPFITKAILVDVAGYIGYDPLPDDFKIDSDIVEKTLHYQDMDLNDIEEGDVLLFYTGWANANWDGDTKFYYSRSPGLTLDTVFNIFAPKKVLLLGSDTFGVEYVAYNEPLAIPLHVHWIVCNGGFLYENLKLVEWTEDARKGDVPYVGGFYYAPAQIEGGVGGMGTPMVIV